MEKSEIDSIYEKTKLSLKEKIEFFYSILILIVFLLIFVFCISETIYFFNNFDKEVPNPFFLILCFMVLGVRVYFSDESTGKLVFIIAFFFFILFSVGMFFSEISSKEYKNIENIDKQTIKSFIGDKKYVSIRDYQNIIRNEERLNNNKAISLQKQKAEQELENIRNKVLNN